MWVLRSLGGLALEGPDSAPLPTVALQRSRLALLAAVASAGEAGISRDRLLALFWPEHDGERARGALKQAIYVLRRDLAAPDLVTGVAELRLNPSLIRSDVSEFEGAMRQGEVARAVALYRGEFLSGVHVATSEFEEWRDAEARRLASLHRQGLQLLARQADGVGDLAVAVEWWCRLAAADPLSAPTCVALMHALVRAGDAPSALRHVALHERLVRAEFDVGPDPSVVHAARQIRSAVEVRRPVVTPATTSLPASSESVAPSTNDSGTASARVSPTAPPENDGEHRVRSRSAGIAFGAGAAALIALAVFGRIEPDAVAIGVVKPGGAAINARRVQSSVEGAVAGRVSGVRIASPWHGRAGYRITVNATVEGDSARFVVSLATPAGGADRRATPVTVAIRDTAAALRAVGDRAAVMIAVARSQRFSRWASRAAIPESWEGYVALEEALGTWIPFGDGANPESFDRSAALDRSSGTAVVLKALGQAKSGRAAEARATIVSLRAQARRLGEWDEKVLSILGAWDRGELSTAHALGHELDDLVPRSEWGVLLAYDAIGVGRADEALDIVERLPADVPWLGQWVRVIRHQSMLMTGDFDGARRDAEGWLRREPESVFFQQSAAKALAGLGRVDEVEALCARSLAQRLTWQPCGQSISELRYHGHLEAARRVADRFLAAMAAEDSLAPVTKDLYRASVYIDAGDWNAARQALARIPAAQRGDVTAWDEIVMDAERGDARSVREKLGQLRLAPTSELMARASVAALLGQRDSAVALLSAAYRHGARRGFRMSTWVGLDRLRGYPPFDSLTGPVRDSHVSSRPLAAAPDN